MKAGETYDDYWKSGLHRTGEWPPNYFEQHLGALIDKKRVLDYGCGLGFSYQRLLVNSVQEYWGADVSAVALADLQKKGLKHLKIRDDSTLDISDDFFDAAVCSEVMEHLYDPLAAGKELFRVIKPGGVLVATVPHFGYFAWRLRALLLARVWDEAESGDNPFKGVHIRYFSIRHFKKLLEFSGFREVTVHPFDRCNIWHLGHALGPLGKPFHWADASLPKWTRLQFLDSISPQLFAQRIRLVALK